ncbi:similar to Saccharomyces cerevisiae YPR070W MED1 Subunit of the RNA polymerase II mediator complex [Maudiozyma saulgeensis]|uniref:Similar to Saccharomyces cerevisiae YPR070W MED1 Subunit of the RNA polymerase II mediator complex n=1 Tax=Maudiozyma saulgeensis TaxID=1789683 RepID=A0A1X7QXI8_9SACH|nr:similar to Saccharomyces cerevisiae YPR070W MED1 Subunit of the RNA polymerase II mediator complex [Kazachstania saulgeensis]
MVADKYTDTLNEMITLLKNYKPGTVTLDNITKLCQTLGLESFIDDVDNEVARLSTASKIIVIDIDFIKSEGKVKDVKLVLASNFDNFNYFENKNSVESDLQTQDKENNILLKSLIDYPNLNEFHENLEFLYLLDSYSQLDVESNNSLHGSSSLHSNTNNHSDSNNNLVTGNLSNGLNNSPAGSNNNNNNNNNNTNNNTNNNSNNNSNNNNNVNGNNNNNTNVSNNNNNNSSSSNGNTQLEKNKLDLFRYYTELSQYIQDYLKDHTMKWNVATNLDSKFGIYIMTADAEPNVVAKITFKKSSDPQHRLYEYIYSKDTKEWINESAESYTMGVSLVMEIISGSTWFPKTFISKDVIFDNNGQTTKFKPTSINDSNDKYSNSLRSFQDPSKLLKLLTNLEDGSHPSNGNELYYHEKIQLINDFTSPLIKVPFFDISNDNIDLIDEVLTWTLWSKKVLENIVELMIIQKNDTHLYNDNHKNNSVIPNVHSDMDNNSNTTIGFNSIDHYRHNSVAGVSMTPTTTIRRRRSSNKGKRPSITEATMFKDEGLQQFNLHDVMSEQYPVITEEDNDDNMTQGPNNESITSNNNTDNNTDNNDHAVDSTKDALAMEDDSRMDIDTMELGNDIEDTREMKEEDDASEQEPIPLIISEDYITLGDIASCNLYEPVSQWETFITSFRQTI